MHHDTQQMGHVLREARKVKGMTQKALAKDTGVALRTIIAIEKEKRFPTYEVFYRIIRTLGLSADHIFWPDKVRYTPEQEQLIRSFFECSEQDQAVIMKTMRVLMQSLHEKATRQ
jgi:DNA-binding XRE family transcriptional regulator